MSKVTVELKKKTIQTAYNQIRLMKKMDFQTAEKGDPFYDLVMEIKRCITREKKYTNKESWIEFLQFWPLSIMVPGMILMILFANYFQW